MPTSRSDGSCWQPDFILMRGFAGAQELQRWFGFQTDFHDAELVECAVEGSKARLRLSAFRITSSVDAEGFFVLDKHAIVTLNIDQVSLVHIDSDIPTRVLELGVPRLDETTIELSYDDVCGGGGSIIAGDVKIAFEPKDHHE